MSIVTFYSYKGGVGRSMSLANIAYELAKRNKKVLMVDWDLEAPGLERYFNHFEMDKRADGLLSLLSQFRNNTAADYKDYLWTINASFEHPIYLLPSGREKDPVKYSNELEHFKWDDFFKPAGGGLHLENLRNQWLKDFDLVLIDSRTGLSDASGVCTIMLPDVVVPMFTANYQSLFGIRDIMNFTQSARQRLSVDRMALTVIPVPSRFGTRVEFKESQEWLDRIADILKDCFSDWLPRWIEPKYMLEQIKIPQVDYFSFGEKLAVVEQGTNDPESMGFIYAKLADFFASDFTDIESFIGKSFYQEKKSAYEKNKPVATSIPQAENKYHYDVFISCPRSAYQWVREVLLPALTEYLQDTLGRSPQIYFDAAELRAGDNWRSNSRLAVEKSKVFLFVFSDAETGKESYSHNELILVESLQQTNPTNIIFPVMFNKGKNSINDLPAVVKDRAFFDFTNFSKEAISSSTRLNSQFGNLVEQVATAIGTSINSIENKEQGAGDTKKQAELDIESLSYAYENLRIQLPASDDRTRLMQDIVEKMKLKATDAMTMLPDLTKSNSAGKRLTAIVTLQVKPDIAYTDWLAEHVGDGEKAFVGYQASVALYNAARSLGSHYTYEVLKAIHSAITNIDKSRSKDPHQIRTLDAAKAELSLNNIAVANEKRASGPEKTIRNESFKTYKWYSTGADRCLAVAKIGKDSSYGTATGFLIQGNVLHPSMKEKLVMLTAAHVIGNGSRDHVLDVSEAVAIFEALNKEQAFRFGDIIWSSPELDVSILEFAKEDKKNLAELTKTLPFFPVAKRLPALDQDQQVSIIGYPFGGTLQLSFEDSVLLDYDQSKIHYRTATTAGSSGSPVFNQQWELIGMHHAGNSNMPHLNGKPGTYSANEGIWIQAIIAAFGRFINEKK